MVDCCRRSFAGGFRDPLPAVDWVRFVQLVRFHRVQGLVWNSLGSNGVEIPAEVARALSADTQRIAATNLRIAAESHELRAAFQRSGIRLLFLKGLTLAALAYPRPMLKMGWDIDLLVAESDVGRAAAELEGRGYRRTAPAATTDLSQWHASRKESVWARPDEQLHVELHSRLADSHRLIPDIGIDSPSREVEIAKGIALPTLAADELFAYLAVHGASSAWFRLKWICDFAALLHGLSASQIERLYDRSQDLGAGRAAGQALLLADRLFGTLGGAPNLRNLLAEDRSTKRLADAAARLLTKAREPTEAFLGTWPIHWTQLLLLPGAGFKLAEIRRQLGSVLKRR
jgi:hypothetical protein